MTGSEYLSADVLAAQWHALDAALGSELAASGQSLQAFLHDRHPGWSVVGRVHFNLAEYPLDPETPFAFLATYTTSLSSRGKALHSPLGRALEEYSGARNQARLLSLLVPVQRAAESCGWLKKMVDAGDVFHPLRWTAAEAYQFLQDVPSLEAAGVIVRLPAAWRSGRPSRPRATATIGTKTPSGVGTEALLDFDMGVTLDGAPLTADEINALLSGADGLRFLRGQWVEVRRETLQKMIDEFGRLERTRRRAWHHLRGSDAARRRRIARRRRRRGRRGREWVAGLAGPWLRDVLAGLRGPEAWPHFETDGRLHATLRPYQDAGVRWLRLLSSLGLGACLADDMGLGKTLQVLALLVASPRRDDEPPALVVAPASLLANWAAEAARFTPSLRVLIAHPSSCRRAELKAIDRARSMPARSISSSRATPRWRGCRGWRTTPGGGRARRGAGDQESGGAPDACGRSARRAAHGLR